MTPIAKENEVRLQLCTWSDVEAGTRLFEVAVKEMALDYQQFMTAG